MPVLAIDQGTTSTRAILVDDDGQHRIICAVEHQQIYPQPGWVEHDPEELIRNIHTCIERSGENVSAIGIANQGESCLAWDATTKKPMTPVIVWQDNRTQDTIDQLKASGAELLVQEKTGLPLDSYFSASKLAWIIKHVPATQTRLQQGKLRLGTTDAFFLDRLTGRHVCDITTASRTSLMNLATGQWDSELCELFGVPIDALPQIVPTTGDFGLVHINSRSIPITASVVDQQASLYGHGCREPGAAKMTFGTGAFALTLTGTEICRAPERGLLPTVAWQRADTAPVYALDGGVYCASSAINWARSLGLFNHFEEINQFSTASAIERDLVFVPALTGLACPHWDRRAAGLWIGLSLNTKPTDMMQAILEGIAFRAAEVITAMNDFVPITGALSIDGGMSANPYFCQFLADVLNREVKVQKLSELTALGTALLAAQSDIDTTPLQAQNTMYRPVHHHQAYRERFADAVSRSKSWTS